MPERDCEFKSRRRYHNLELGCLQQSNAFHEKDGVGGSSPSLPTILPYGELAQLVEHVTQTRHPVITQIAPARPDGSVVMTLRWRNQIF